MRKHVAEWYAERHHLVSIDIHVHLWGIDTDRRRCSLHLREVIGVGRELASQIRKLTDVGNASRLQVHLESGRRSQPGNLGRVEPKDDRLLDLCKSRVRRTQDRIELVTPSLPLHPNP